MNPGGQVSDSRDLVLAPGSYAYVQAENNGSIKTFVGPTVVTLSGQDRPVRFEPSRKQFTRCNQDQAVMPNIAAGEGDYVILENPAKGEGDSHSHPSAGAANSSPSSLHMGTRIVIAGPCNFALWPGQAARTLQGHHLSSNEYLVARVYNEEAARKNWKSGVQTVKKEEDETKGDSKEQIAQAQAKVIAQAQDKAKDVTELQASGLRLGQLIIIRGDRVSFYIPPTGIEVLAEGKGDNPYVRSAVTLERLEYCILVDEDGEKRYERGPQVVFPKPTERFIRGKKGKQSRKFRAIELTRLSGLHIKVIHEYEENGHEYKAGDEIFITGEDQSIYFPRIEHSIIKYGDDERHYATAIPTGEGRYVLNRNTGVISTACGPKMLLLDPRETVQVRRILGDKECDLWYPGNVEAKTYNKTLRGATAEAASTGYVEEAYSRGASGYKGLVSSSLCDTALSVPEIEEAATDEIGVEEFGRKTSYTPPRTVTLDTKYDGVPAISVWTGYAVMVVNKSGKRVVVQGPNTHLLEYDETLEILEMSTGKPKTTDKMHRTVYLQVKNNKVSDIVAVETNDHVGAKIKLSLLVNFEGEDPEKWFEASNYVKLLCDHVRSVLKGTVQKVKIEAFYVDHVAIIRDAILGKSVDGERPGMRFAENGMIVRDVEVLGFDIEDKEVSQMLIEAQRSAVSTNIKVQNEERDLQQLLRRESINQQISRARNETKRCELDLEEALNAKTLQVNLKKLAARTEQAEQELLANQAQEEAASIEHQFNLSREKETAQQRVAIQTQEQQLLAERLKSESEAMVARFMAAKDGLTEAAVALSRDDVATKVAQAMSMQQVLGGGSFVEVVRSIFKDTPLSGLADRISLPRRDGKSDRMTADV